MNSENLSDGFYVMMVVSEEWHIEQQFDADHWFMVSTAPSVSVATRTLRLWKEDNPDEVYRVMHIEVKKTEVEM